jgi:hypothetical protein
MAGANAAGGRVVSIILLGMLASSAMDATAFAQAGATGGTIGKTDKSVSGGGEAREPAPKVKRAQPQPAKSRIFENPTINNIRVDRCLRWGTDCGAPAADHWCQSKGFKGATDFSVEIVHPTILQDSHRTVCDSFYCGAFKRIVCG